MKDKNYFKNYILLWLEDHKNYIKESTYSNYLIIINNHLLKDFNSTSIEQFSNKLLQEYVILKLNSGSMRGGALSQKSVKDIIVVLKQFLRHCFKNEIIKDFSLDIRYPKETKDRIPKTMKIDDYRKLIQYLIENDSPFNNSTLLVLLSGIRIGELCALQYSDFNFRDNTFSINKTLQRIYYKDNSKVVITSPKTNSSIREIPIPNILCNRIFGQSDNYILTNSTRALEPRIVRDKLRSLLLELEIPYIKFHGLRHTFATMCVENEIDYKTISILLGHSNINTTLNLYVHPNEEQKRNAIDKLVKIAI